MFRLSKMHKHQLYLIQCSKGESIMNKPFGSVGVFPPIEPMHLISALLLGILNVITKSRLNFLILITAPKMPNLSLIPLKPSCHPQHDMRDEVLKYAIAHINK